MAITLKELGEYLEKNKRFRIVFVGDSITSTEWVHPNWREIVEYVLKEELQPVMDDWRIPSWGIRGINSGLDGATTKDVLDRVTRDILNYEPDLVIGLMGGNDPTFDITPEETKDYLTRLLNMLAEQVPWTVWCTSTPAARGARKNLEYEPYAKTTMSIGDKDNVKLLDMFSLYQQYDDNKFFTFISEAVPEEGIKAGDRDVQHPNQLGNAYIAKVLLKEIFDIEFDPEVYLKSSRRGDKLPLY